MKYGTHIIRNIASVALGTAVFTMFFFLVLFAFEARTAYAWHCLSFTATPNSIQQGDSSTLAWSFFDDENITVTIDQLPGESWVGTTGSTVVSPMDTTEYRAVAHKEGTDEVFDCKTTVRVEPPDFRVPACPFTESENVTVVDFNSGKERSVATIIYSSGGLYKIEKPLQLEPGVYTVHTASWDGYANRVNVLQPNEKWNIEVRSDSTVLAQTGPTTDIADYVVENMQTDTFTEDLNFSTQSNNIAVVHAAYPDRTSPNSVVPVCLALEKKKDTNVPMCHMAAAPDTIIEGEQSNLSWDSAYVTSVDIDNGIGTDLSSTGSKFVSPATTTVYTGTFHAIDGATLTCDAKVTVEPKGTEPKPRCTMNISPTSVNSGGTSLLTWTSSNATYARIDQGLGTVPLNGSTYVTVNSNTVYTGIFKDNRNNEVTCTASVTTKKGGGSCLNCDDDDDDDEKDEPEPTIILGKSISRPYITLDKVPYTGFTASPMATAVFWFVVLLFSIGIAYMLTYRRPFWTFKFAGEGALKTSYMARVAEMNPETIFTAGTVLPNVTVPQIILRTNSERGDIEEMAHNENILLSPEALRLIELKVKDEQKDPATYLAQLFTKVKGEYPREDGWVLLSKERAEVLLGKHKARTIEIERSDEDDATEQHDGLTQKSQVQSHTAQKTATKNNAANVVSKFIDSLIHVERKEAFDLLRSMTTKGIDIAAFMTLVVRQLDDVYKERIEGNRNPEDELVQKTKSWTEEDFETVLGILVECIDYSYSNNRIGTKIALAKAFEYFEKKKKK